MLSVTPNVTRLVDANVGSETFSLTVVFNKSMDTSTDPTISFPTSGEDPTASPVTLTLDSGTWTNDTTFVATYDVADQNVSLPAVDVQVSDATDYSGNTQIASTLTDKFGIDTQDPNVASVTPSLTTIAEANVGSQAFTITVVFDSTMDTTVNPTISFPTSGEDPTARRPR